MNFYGFIDRFSKYLLQEKLEVLSGLDQQAETNIARANFSAEEKKRLLEELKSSDETRAREKERKALEQKIQTGVDDEEKIKLLKEWLAREDGNIRRMFDKKTSDTKLNFVSEFIPDSMIHSLANKAEIKDMNINNEDSLKKAFSEMTKPLENDVAWKKFWENRKSPEDEILKQKILYGYRFRMITSIRKQKTDLIASERDTKQAEINTLKTEIAQLKKGSSERGTGKLIASKEKLLAQKEKALDAIRPDVARKIAESAKETAKIQSFNGKYSASALEEHGLQTESSAKRKIEVDSLLTFADKMNKQLNDYAKEQSRYVTSMTGTLRKSSNMEESLTVRKSGTMKRIGNILSQFNSRSSLKDSKSKDVLPKFDSKLPVDSNKVNLEQTLKLKSAISLFKGNLNGITSENAVVTAKSQLSNTIGEIYKALQENQQKMNESKIIGHARVASRVNAQAEGLKKHMDNILIQIGMQDRIESLRNPKAPPPAPERPKPK